MPTIDVPDNECKDKIWIDKLTESDENILVSGRWLNDSIINAAQCLISERFPRINGLQNTILGLPMSYEINKGEFVQILHNGHGHWITISTYGCESGVVNVFDSLLPVVSSSIKQQTAAILCLAPAKTEIILRYSDCILVITLPLCV